MKSLFSFGLFIFLLINSLSAQIGISAGYLNLTAPEFQKAFDALENLTSDSQSYNQGTYQIAVDYWFRLKNKRIEFMPELSYMSANALVNNEVGIDAAYSNVLELNSIQFNFNTNIYPFDFEGDCDCPTFSKDGDILKKGFFVRLAPGVSMNQFSNARTEITLVGSETENLSETGFAYNLRAGIGLDIGVSDFFTVTPIAQYTFISKSEPFYAYQNPAFSANRNRSSLRPFFVGLRLGFRFDEMNKYGYR